MNFGTKHVRVMVYAGDHPPPHCHVVRKDGSETRVIIPTLIILTGSKLTREERDLIIEKLDELCDEFDKLNPQQH